MTEHVIVHQILCLSVIDNIVHVWTKTSFPYLAYVSWTPVHSTNVLCVANQKHRLVLGLVHLPNIVCDVSISQGKCTHTEEKMHNSHTHTHVYLYKIHKHSIHQITSYNFCIHGTPQQGTMLEWMIQRRRGNSGAVWRSY